MSTYIDNHNGDIYYYKNAEMTILHREEGPAIEYANGHKFWYLNGNLHRIDGPALEYTNGTKAWYVNGKCMNFQKWKEEVRCFYDNQEDYLLMLLKM